MVDRLPHERLHDLAHGPAGRPEAGLGATATAGAALMGRQNVPRDQWLELGYECPRCGEQISEADVYSWRPLPEDPKLLLLYCPNCGDRVEINHI